MKPLKKHYNYIFLLYLPIFLLALAIAIFFPQQAALCFRGHWLVLFFTLFLALSPLGKIRLGVKDTAMKFSHWLGLILIISCSVTFIYCGLFYLSLQGLPVLFLNHINNIPNSAKTLIITWGVYPWFIYLLFSVGLAYIGYVAKKPGKFSFLLPILFKNTADDATSLSVDFITRTIIHFSFATAAGIITLLTVALFVKINQTPIAVGLNFVTLIVATILFVGINTPQWQKAVRYCAVKIPLPLLIILYIILAAFIVVIANYAISLFVANFPQGNKTLLTFHIPHWKIYWQLLTGMWWLGWTPLIAGTIAVFSRGYQIRTVILGGIVIIVINGLLLSTLTQTNFIYNFHFLPIYYFLPWLGLILIGSFFLRKKYLSYLMRAVLPGTQLEKPRSTLFYTQSLLQSLTFFLILYLPLGIYVISIFVFIMIFPLAIVIAINCVALVKLFLSKKKGA